MPIQEPNHYILQLMQHKLYAFLADNSNEFYILTFNSLFAVFT